MSRALDKLTNTPRVNPFFQKIDLFVQLTEELHALESAPFGIQTAYSIINCFQ